ncbi:PREDICTED: cyclin N-terminal domain-containing protein 1 isoform X2 [Lepidothrix coronata]|uniref:Cyclin N-terminal domain-containing protein 1 isoform X2 n=1 Tax=Lepidothrix coronata TaxID=321398 RepID=A0A6J0ISY8_9PASS|nr:PREDICTED: cyclin N-terminal domain-containing protein 1 isoform X2 [Lepidothrix coronata]
MGSPVPVEPWGRDPGPVFSGVTPEIIEDTLIHLATENEQYLSELPEHAGSFKDTRIVEFIFLLSEKWRLDQSTRYQAVELLERFMIKQVEQLWESSSGSVKGGAQGQGSSWSSVRDQIVDTFVLRLVSCIQLASKLSLHYSELLESELAVLNTLHFHINVSTPLAYVELLLEVLGHNGCLLPAKPLHHMCVQLLDFCYLSRETIYDTLLKIAIENSTPSELQSQVLDSEGRFHALGCWNHQHRHVHPEPWALGAGCGAFELYHWHYSTKHQGVLVRGAEAHPGQRRAQAAPWELWDQSSQRQDSAPEIEPPCLELSHC